VALHVRGVFLPDETERDAWVVAGRLTFSRPDGEHDTVAAGGWVTPGFVDAHCHVGLAPSGHAPDPDEQAQQALLDRTAGALLLRDAGTSPGRSATSAAWASRWSRTTWWPRSSGR
jgi:imidazolonepropionase-like amidohydrolase